eukprot:jgi/Psemu1/9734/gm1.9734_g
MKNSADISWCPLPTAFFETLLSTRDCYGIYKKGNEIDRILNINPNIGGNLFDLNVIDGRVYSGNHFSQFFIFNAKSLKGYNKSKFMENDDLNHPFILYANSLPDCGWHSTDKVAEKHRKFLNKYGLEHNVFKVRACSKNTIPAIKIDVPVQSDTWTCGYQCLVTRYHIMKKLQDGQKILLKNVESGEINFCDGRKDSDLLLSTMVRNDIPSPSEIVVINDSDGKAEKEPPRPIRRPEHTKKKRKSDQSAGNTAAQRRGMARKKEQKRSKNRRVNGDHKELTVAIRKASRFLDWRKGEPATSLEAYHDDAYHAALYHFSSCTEIYQAMCDYQSEHANRKLPKASSIAIIKNCPQRLLITREQDRSKVKELVDDLYNNFVNYKFVSDPNTIDFYIGQVRTTKEGHQLDLRLLALSQRRQEPPTKSRTTNRDSTTEDFSRRITTLEPPTETRPQKTSQGGLPPQFSPQRKLFSPTAIQMDVATKLFFPTANYHRWLRDPFQQKFQEHTTVQASPSRELDWNYHGDRIFPHPITPVQMDVATSHSTQRTKELSQSEEGCAIHSHRNLRNSRSTQLSREHTTIQGPFLESSTGITNMVTAFLILSRESSLINLIFMGQNTGDLRLATRTTLYSELAFQKIPC